MADYIGITEAQSNPFAPLTSELVKQLRDNPIAIAEGAEGAPRLYLRTLEQPEVGDEIQASVDEVVRIFETGFIAVMTFGFIQSGNVRISAEVRQSGGASTGTNHRIVRRRGRESTTLAEYVTTGSTWVPVSADFAVLPGDVITFEVRRQSETIQSETRLLRLKTAGQDLWPAPVYMGDFVFTPRAAT